MISIGTAVMSIYVMAAFDQTDHVPAILVISM